MASEGPRYVSRGGLKLRHALDEFRLDVHGFTCADFGSNVGGFTDCMLQAGAARVYAVDTGYGNLAWTLRNDPRVAVMERTNAMHAAAPAPVDLVVVDLAWTPQRHAIPAAVRWLKPNGRVITLIKPHYELDPDEKHLLRNGVLAEPDAERVTARIVESMPALGVRVVGVTRSPILGGASKKKSHGNAEWLALMSVA
jgi:23S rRNA (cytidine1920-2'-O)/16S rRNA (cytidine1409-2'-O)-methyltransferase